MTDKELKALAAENTLSIKRLIASQDRTDKQIEELKASQDKTDKQIEKTDRQLERTDKQLEATDKQVKETSRRVDKIARMYGDSENNKRKVTEEHFYQFFRQQPQLNGVHFDEVHRNFYSIQGYEHDILMTNSRSAAVFSVKYRVRKAAVNHLIHEELPRLRASLDDVEVFYLGIASEYVDPDVRDYADRKGLFVLSQSGGNARLVNSAGFSPKKWQGVSE